MQNEKEGDNRWVRILPGEALADILRQMRSPEAISTSYLKNVKAELRPYQLEGVNWLTLLSNLGLGACLADDMGLGKTLQILSLLINQGQNQAGAAAAKVPSLLVVPASLLSNWQREAARFTPSLKLFFLHPSELKGMGLSDIEKSTAGHLEGIDL